MAHKILSVDDSRTIRMIIKKALSEYECELFEAENGRDGLALASEKKPDLVILDITMPVMTGIEMLTKMKQDNAIKEIPVIMLTAESGRDNVMNIVKMGVRDYIVKPFKGDQLIERIKLILNDLKQRINLSGGRIEGENQDLFTVDGDIVILTLPSKIARGTVTEIEGLMKEKIDQMAMADTNKLIVNLSKIENLSMAAIQSLLGLINLCIRSKLALRMTATPAQVDALKGFKETSVIPVKGSVEEAIQDF
ncbi:MAG: response regulator [Desulfobacteraceae bacterium]|nr:response regulator [Desulfobacteraceae bacterium]